MDNDATSDDRTRKKHKDESPNSLLAPRGEQSTQSIVPSPDGTHKKTEEGKDPTSDEENGNAESPFFNPSVNPDGVFAKLLVKHKGDINTHDQQALWGESCAYDTLEIDTNQLVLDKFHKQIIYNQVRPTIDLCASDLCSSFRGLDCSGNNASSTIRHDKFSVPQGHLTSPLKILHFSSPTRLLQPQIQIRQHMDRVRPCHQRSFARSL